MPTWSKTEPVPVVHLQKIDSMLKVKKAAYNLYAL